ncbi:endoribonuclease Arlr-like [Hetaerina americana]|uniref:endoribonuclease Arlr-like n=1 Tax=Hetaerina americana TaxID=62018 RepID=UPI003A7F4748
MPKLELINWFFLSNAATSSTSNEELASLSEQLLKNDINNAANLISVNVQGRVSDGNKNDKAPKRLLTVDSRAWSIPTISRLRLLFNNFVPDVRKSENVTSIEKAEENNFLDAILDTPIMEKTQSFLAHKGYISHDRTIFKEALYDLWFSLYPRGKGELGSSGIEHVFLGELKNGKVSGFHNWVFFNNEELQQFADYLGFIQDVDLGSKGHVLKFTFKWRNTYKPVGTMFIGTSPELELALYTICYLTRPNQMCRLKLGGHPVSIQTYQLSYNGKSYVASAFPTL